MSGVGSRGVDLPESPATALKQRFSQARCLSGRVEQSYPNLKNNNPQRCNLFRRPHLVYMYEPPPPPPKQFAASLKIVVFEIWAALPVRSDNELG